MAIKFIFGGKTVIEPGSYSRIIGGSSQVPPTAAFGKVMLIDTGKMEAFGIGSGINGELANGKKAVYEFADPTEFKEMMRGGVYYDLADYLFKPSSNGQGVDSVKYVSAATTTPAVIDYAFTNGTLSIKTRTEGIKANGILYGGVLAKGFAAKMQAGVIDPTKYMMIFYHGTFAGINDEAVGFSIPKFDAATTYNADVTVHYNGFVWKSLQGTNTGNNPVTSPTFWKVVAYTDNYGDNMPGATPARAIAASPEFTNLNDLVNWMKNNPTFNAYFKLVSSTVTGTGDVIAADLTANANYELAAGGTSTYASTDFDAVLDNIAEEDNSFFLCDDYALTAKSANNSKLLSFIKDDAEFKKIMVLGGGYDNGYLKGANGSIGIAQYFNSSNVTVVHGGVKVPKLGGGEKELTSIYHAALYLGRTAGLEPQVTTTWKDIRISAPVHELSKKERELALMSGVIHTKFVDGKGWVINQSINTLQRNDTLFLPDGDSYEVSIERIKMQLNKELVLSSRVLFVGGNLNTASAEDVKLFVEGYLVSRTARPNLDNLIISFRDIKVELRGDAWFVSYGFVPNSPINKLFFTGVMLDANISI